jgi:purine-nucleoside phosphorylase
MTTGAESDRVREAASILEARLSEPPEAFVVLGSGLGGLSSAVEGAVEIPFEALPGFPPAGVAGHEGRLLAGRIEGRPVLLQAGRYHLYEGHPPETVVRPVRVAAALGVRTLLVTNAAGGLDLRLSPGTLLLLDDVLNFQFRSALAGAVVEGEERFPDMSAPFDPELQRVALEVAAELGIPLPRGSYVAVTGPSYETPAEVRMLSRMGAQAVGMSTVLEVTVARARGMRVLGFSLITNPGAGLLPGLLDHEEVLEVGKGAALRLEALVRGIVARLSPDAGRASGRSG